MKTEWASVFLRVATTRQKFKHSVQSWDSMIHIPCELQTVSVLLATIFPTSHMVVFIKGFKGKCFCGQKKNSKQSSVLCCGGYENLKLIHLISTLTPVAFL